MSVWGYIIFRFMALVIANKPSLSRFLTAFSSLSFSVSFAPLPLIHFHCLSCSVLPMTRPTPYHHCCSWLCPSPGVCFPYMKPSFCTHKIF
jgi:hypothetical protein